MGEGKISHSWSVTKLKLTPEDIDEMNEAIRDFIIEKNQNNNCEDEVPKMGPTKIKYRFRYPLISINMGQV